MYFAHIRNASPDEGTTMLDTHKPTSSPSYKVMHQKGDISLIWCPIEAFLDALET